YVSGDWDDEIALRLLDHPSADARAWAVRLVGDERRELGGGLRDRLVRLAAEEPSAIVRSPLACTCKRLPRADGLPIIERLLTRSEDAADLHIPLLLWWAIEDKATSDWPRMMSLLAPQQVWRLPLVEGTIVERLARRYLAEKSELGYAACARLL